MERYLSTKEAAMHANVSVATINLWCKSGYLGNFGHVRTGFGNGYQIPLSKLEDFLKSHKKYSKKRNETKPEATEKPAKIDKKKDIPVESLMIAATNLRIAIRFAEEELNKIENLLKDEA